MGNELAKSTLTYGCFLTDCRLNNGRDTSLLLGASKSRA
jgi:hypothetical protein